MDGKHEKGKMGFKNEEIKNSMKNSNDKTEDERRRGNQLTTKRKLRNAKKSK